MPINANVSGGQQITASVGETQIDVSVSGGVGPTGTPGAAASVTVGTVTTGAPGSSASVVNAGTSSAAVLNFTIPAGATGATGSTGPQGERGEQGIQGIQGVAGIQGPAGATGPAGTTTWAGITDKPSTFTPSSHQHVAADISDFTSAVIAAAPPTTNASLLTSGTLPDARLSANIARTSDITTAVANVVNAAPAALDTLNELAAALGNDASFATTVTNSLAGKAALVHTHTVSAITDAGTAATRNAPATGNAATTEVVLGSDTRLTDSRTPTSHTHGGISNFGTISDQISAAQANPVAFAGLTGLIGCGAWGTTSGTFCQGNDSRLSDARTPLSHTHSAVDVTAGQFDIARIPTGQTSTTVPLGNDARFTDARTPTGAAGGDLTGTYPNPTIAPGAVVTADLADAAVTTAKLADSAVTDAKVSAVAASKLTGTVALARLPIVLEQTQTVGNSGTSTTLALTTGSVQTVTLNGNCTFTMPSPTAGASITLILTQGGTFTATFTSVLWAGGTAPTITATSNKRDILVFVSDGTNWYGTASQNH